MVVVKLWPCLLTHAKRKRFRSKARLEDHIAEYHTRLELSAHVVKQTDPDLVGAPTLKEAKAQMVDRHLLLDKEQLRAIDIRTLRALKSAVCHDSCDQLGGYHGGGCKQLRSERERREKQAKAQKAGAIFVVMCADCGTVDFGHEQFRPDWLCISGDDVLRLDHVCKGHGFEDWKNGLPPYVVGTRFIFPDTDTEVE